MRSLVHSVAFFLFFGIGVVTAHIVVFTLIDPEQTDKTWVLFFFIVTILSFLISWLAWKHP